MITNLNEFRKINESNIPTFDQLVNLEPVNSDLINDNFKVVTFAWDDEGNNMFALLDLQNNNIISYSISGKKEIDAFHNLSKEEFSKKWTELHEQIHSILESYNKELYWNVNGIDDGDFENVTNDLVALFNTKNN